MTNTKKLNDKKNENANANETVSWSEKGGMVRFDSLSHRLTLSELLQFATEAIDSIRTVVGLHQEEYFISNYENCFNLEFK